MLEVWRRLKSCSR